MRRTPEQLNSLAAGFVAKALANVHPLDRPAIMAAMLTHLAAGMIITTGSETTVEALNDLAESVSLRSAAA